LDDLKVWANIYGFNPSEVKKEGKKAVGGEKIERINERKEVVDVEKVPSQPYTYKHIEWRGCLWGGLLCGRCPIVTDDLFSKCTQRT